MSRIISLLVLGAGFLVVIGACAPLSEGQFMAEADAAEQPDTLYMVVDSWEGEEDLECEVYEFKKMPTTDPHGKHHYAGDRKTLSNPLTEVVFCDDYDERDRPPLVVNNVPPDFAEMVGVKNDFTLSVQGN